MRVGWILRLEDENQNVVSGVLRMSKEEADKQCAKIKEQNKDQNKTKAEIVSVYSEYLPEDREVKKYENKDLKALLRELCDLNPLVLGQEGISFTIEVDKVTSV